MSINQCAACGANLSHDDTLHTASDEQGDRLLCANCFHREIARHIGIDEFDAVKFEPVRLTDCSGNVHEFRSRSFFLGDNLFLEAFDTSSQEQASGYRFQIPGNPLADRLTLLGKLIEKMRRYLAVVHIRDSDLGFQIVDETVRGRIEWDGVSESHMPCVVIDGHRVGWDEFGRMLMTFEGWQFKLEVRDPSDEI
jgi:hypothetical protein